MLPTVIYFNLLIIVDTGCVYSYQVYKNMFSLVTDAEEIVL